MGFTEGWRARRRTGIGQDNYDAKSHSQHGRSEAGRAEAVLQ